MLALLGGDPVRTSPVPVWPIHGEQERSLLLRVLDSGIWSYDGPMEAEFSAKFAEFCHASYAFCVPNGTQSLELALRALEVGPGDEVILPALTWTAPAWAVVQAGAIPVFIDIREEDWCLDPDRIGAALTPATRAIIPVHMFSQVAEMDQILEIAAKGSLHVLEDCAHSHGSQWNGRCVGTLGDIGSFSCQQGKLITAGEGGIVITNREDLADRLYGLKNCGRPWRSTSEIGFSGNYRITEFQAAILLAQLDRLAEQLHIKETNVAAFRRQIAAVPGVYPLARKEKVTKQNMFGLSIRIDPDKFAGVSPSVLVDALMAEGVAARPSNEVLYKSSLWRSGVTARRWHKNADAHRMLGLNAYCPVAERVEAEGFILSHETFLGNLRDVEDVVTAFEKVQRHAHELSAIML